MILRQAYLNGKKTFNDYYGQFVTEETKNLVIKTFGKETLKKSLLADEHLNNLPLINWDNLTSQFNCSKEMKKAGDYPTLAGKVCILKESARRVILEG